jgi:hypothetical protein
MTGCKTHSLLFVRPTAIEDAAGKLRLDLSDEHEQELARYQKAA